MVGVGGVKLGIFFWVGGSLWFKAFFVNGSLPFRSSYRHFLWM